MNSSIQTLPCDILIVGAGIAGSAMACALRDKGYSVVQVEMSDRPLDTTRGDHLQCVVAEIIESWGALQAFWEAGAEKRHAARYLTNNDELLLEIDYRSLPVPHPYYLYLHHELIAQTFLKLAAENPDYILIRPARARDFETGPEGIRSLTVNLSPDSAAPEGLEPGQTVKILPHLVIGADGRSSRVREALQFSSEQHDYERPILVQFAPRLSPNEDPLNRFTTFMSPKGSVSRIPRAFGGWKIGLTIDKTDIPFWKNASLDMRKAAVASIAPQLEPLDFELGGFYPVKLLNTHTWTKGNTVLVGDACHAMHPTRGQGMNVAIRCLSKLIPMLPEPQDLHNVETLAKQLRTYEQKARPHIDSVLAENHARGQEHDHPDSKSASKTMDELKAIQDNPETHRKYCLNAAGYGESSI